MSRLRRWFHKHFITQAEVNEQWREMVERARQAMAESEDA